MPRLNWFLITAIATSWLASAAADTLKEQAKKAVAAGLDAQNAGRYDEAIAHYRKAYDAVPHHEILFNLAQAYRLKGDPETALGYYQRYLLVEPKGRVAADAKKWIAALEKVIAQRNSDARNAPTAAPGTAQPDPARAAEPAKPGIAKADPARTGEFATTDAKPDLARMAETAMTEPANAGATKPEANANGASTPAPLQTTSPMPVAPPRDEGSLIARQRYAMVAAVAGGAFVLGGVVFGAIARNRRDDALAICGDDRKCDTDADAARANDLMATSRARGTTSTVMVVLGGAGLVTGAVLWFKGRESPARPALAPVIAPSVVGVAWGGRF